MSGALVLAACGGRPSATPDSAPPSSPSVRTPEATAAVDVPCVRAPAGPGPSTSWQPLAVSTTYVDGQATAVPVSPDALPSGGPLRRPWTAKGEDDYVLHEPDGTTQPVSSSEYVLSTVGRGYVTVGGESADYTWHREDQHATALGSAVLPGVYAPWSTPIPSSSHAGSQDVPLLVSGGAGTPPWTVTVVGANGCRQDLDFTAASEALAASVAPLPATSCGRGGPLGFLRAGEYAAMVECGGGTTDQGALKVRLVTTSGRLLGLAGLRRADWRNATVMTRNHVVVVPGGDPNFAELRAYDTRTSRPLWARRYVVGGKPMWMGLLTASPSGRRMFWWCPDGSFVLDSRTGLPIARLDQSRSVKQTAFEDDDTLLFVDDGQPLESRDESNRAAWVVRCRLGGACELATPVLPAQPPVSIEIQP